MAIVSRFLLKPNTATKLLSSSRSFFTTTASSSLCRFRSRSALDGLRPRLFEPALRALAVRRLSSSLNEQMQSTKFIYNYTRVELPNSPPREGSDLKPYIVFTVPSSEYTRDELIEGYIWCLSHLWGSEEEAKKKIYSVSTKYYYTFGAFLTKEQARYLHDCVGIREVVPDSHFDVENMEYGDTKLFGGEPFINGKAVPYDQKYHEAWTRYYGDKEYEVEEDFDSETVYRGSYYWSMVMEEPKSNLSRDEIIDSYIKTLAGVVGSEEEARKMLYSVSTRVSYSFSAHLSYSSAQKLKNMPGVKSVRLDVDLGNKKYGEPFINGEAVPYNPKYHEKCETNSCPKFDWFNNIGKEERESPKRKSKDDEPAVRALAVRRLSSSLNEQMQSTKIFNYTRVELPNSPPREGSDLKPYIVFTVPPSSEYSRDELIEGYVRLLYCFWGSKKDAKEKIYSVSTRFYYTFGALLTKEQVKYFKNCIGIREVLPDLHFDVENMEYGDTKLFGGEPFINGKAVPYDPKYHEAWIRTNGEKDYEEDYESEDDDFGVDHWSVLMEEPKSYLSRDEIIDSYIKTLAGALGSEEEARKQLYWVSTRVSYSFSALLFYCSAQKLKNMPGVKSVSLDVDVKNKKYGEPFTNGEAVPYDPKYHERCNYNSCPEFDWFKNRT